MAKGSDYILADFEIVALVQFTDKGSDVLVDFEIFALIQFTDKWSDVLVEFEILALVQFTDKGSDVLVDFEILALVQFTDKGSDVLAKWALHFHSLDFDFVGEPESTANFNVCQSTVTSMSVRAQ